VICITADMLLDDLQFGTLDRREVDALVAERVLGWRWMEWDTVVATGKIGQLKVIVPPDGGRYVLRAIPSFRLRPAAPTTPRCDEWDELTWDGCLSRAGMPHWSTDVAADYAVLKHLKDKDEDGSGVLSRTCDYIVDLWKARSAERWPCQYLPGDWSRAALAVVMMEAQQQEARNG
jgi:hypothetical protein